jgi:hypothetical protein
MDLEAWGYKQELTGDLINDISRAIELLKQETQITDFLADLVK